MKKINTSPISGMQELLPGAQAIFNSFKSDISDIFFLHGFQAIETPTIDRAEILLAKAGGDTEKQIYKVVKTAETADDADQALRFDHTVPLARYVVEHENDLAFPFKVTQIGRNFRGERAQKGRFREFYQCDVDVIGRGSLPLAYDAEVIATLYDALVAMHLPAIKIRISNRKLLSGFLEALNLTEFSADIFNIIDHAEKVAPAVTKQAFLDLGISEENVVKITTFMQISGNSDNLEAEFAKLGVDSAKFSAGVSELLTILRLLESQGLKDIAVADLLIVRGLDYYTGTVFEMNLPEYKHIGSICGGGRYENLAEYYTDQPLPGVGGSIGLTRLFYVLNANHLIATESARPIDTAIIPLSENEYPFAFELANEIRQSGRSADVLLIGKKLGDMFKYAAKIADNAIVIGEDEVKSGQYNIKKLN